MRRGLLAAALVAVALAGRPAAAYADDADPIVYRKRGPAPAVT